MQKAQLVTSLCIIYMIVTKTPHEYIRVTYKYMQVTYGYIRATYQQHTSNIPATHGYIRVHTGKTRALARFFQIFVRKGKRVNVFKNKSFYV